MIKCSRIIFLVFVCVFMVFVSSFARATNAYNAVGCMACHQGDESVQPVSTTKHEKKGHKQQPKAQPALAH